MTVDQQQITLAVLSEEVAHELAGPVRFLDVLLRDLSRGVAMQPEDLSIALEEIDRLKKLLATLRRIHVPEPPTMPLALAPLVERAIAACAAPRDAGAVDIVRDLSPGLTVEVHPSYAEQTLAPLFRVAIACLAEGGRVVVVAPQRDQIIALEIRLTALAHALPRPSFASSPAAFDLLSAQRLALGYGHTLELEHVDGGAVLRLRLPSAPAESPSRKTSDAHPDRR